MIRSKEGRHIGERLALLVDDELPVLEFLDDCMHQIGMDTILARDGEEAWQLFLQNQPPLVITDIYMPKKNGIILLRQIKRQFPDTLVILITGHPVSKGFQKFGTIPPDAFLEKPFDLETLLKSIQKALSAPFI